MIVSFHSDIVIVGLNLRSTTKIKVHTHRQEFGSRLGVYAPLLFARCGSWAVKSGAILMIGNRHNTAVFGSNTGCICRRLPVILTITGSILNKI